MSVVREREREYLDWVKGEERSGGRASGAEGWVVHWLGD